MTGLGAADATYRRRDKQRYRTISRVCRTWHPFPAHNSHCQEKIPVFRERLFVLESPLISLDRYYRVELLLPRETGAFMMGLGVKVFEADAALERMNCCITSQVMTTIPWANKF